MIKAFKQELKDNIDLSNHSIAYNLDIRELQDIALARIENYHAVANLQQPDLFYIDSILVTLGWNLNDDVFLKEHVFPAKDTPVDKPFNREHNQDDIIGHMTSSRLLNSEYEPVDNDDFTHIAVSSVIYKVWKDKEKQTQISQMIQEILDGKWKVSMECIFNSFDYSLIKPDGSKTIIKRTPETSYLTKYLRAHKGSGMINGNKIGRVLCDITFSGKGLVEEPGNPYSIIFNTNKISEDSSSKIKEFVMNELELAKAELLKVQAERDKIKSEFESAKADLEKVNDAKVEATIAEKDEKIKAQSEQISALQADVAKITQTLATVQASLEAAVAQKDEAIAGFQLVKTELDQIKTDAAIAKRKNALAQVVAAERVETLMAKFAKLDDESFDGVVAELASSKSMKTECKDGVKNKEDEKEDEKEEEKTETKADLAKAELDKDIAGHASASKNNVAFNEILEYLLKTSKNKVLS